MFLQNKNINEAAAVGSGPSGCSALCRRVYYHIQISMGFMTFQSNRALHLSDTAELPVVIEYKSGSSALDRL